ncbi:hypothetical protein [Corynebacterium sp. CCM 9203]|uniref:hypothetical protein n=1 Tax=Corynebacterium sp. CCM 9203 TaxID=3057615 RepID=UPI003525CAE7
MNADLRTIAQRGTETVLDGIEKAQLSNAFWNVGILQRMEKTLVQNPILKTFWAAQVRNGDKRFLSSDTDIRSILEQRGDIHHIFPRNYLKNRDSPIRISSR